jgi:hypothetical protein
MSILVSQQTLPRMRLFRRWAATPAAWALFATLFVVITTLVVHWPSLSDSLGDTDDAVRLVSVRELLAGAPWFDTTLPRIGAPEPLVSHWSRLIDAPLGVMLAAFSPLLGQDGGELATRILWPALLFLTLAVIIANEAHRRAGPLAAALALYLVTSSAAAIAQFHPGRIDHHNAQVLCAVSGLLFLARSWDDLRYGWIAGALLGLGLAVGYEAMPLVVPALGLAAFAAIWHPRNGAKLVRAATAATTVLFVALASTVPPGRLLDVRCDSLSLNLPVLAAFATAGLWVALSGGPNRAVRFAILGAFMVIGGAVYARLEPACLAGPFGQLNAALKPIWLDHVLETRSLLQLDAGEPTTAVAAVAFIFAGVAAQYVLWRRQPDAGMGVAAAFTALAACLGCWQLRFLPYAAWLAAVPLAVWAAKLPGTPSLSAPVRALAVVVLLSHATLDASFSVFRRSTIPGETPFESGVLDRPCFLSGNVRRLAALPPGLVAADIDLGAYIVALSPHRVVAAPYHRLDKGILVNHAILHGTPDEAKSHLRTLGVTYVALCTDRQPRDTDNSLLSRLLGGEPPPFLRELDLPPGTPIRVWKVTPVL